MTTRLRRTGALVALGALLAACGPAPAPVAPVPPAAPAAAPAAPAAPPALARLERDSGGRIGVFALDTGTGRTVAHRADERFAHASTFKALLVAVVLDATTPAELDRVVPVVAEDLLPNSPVTGTAVGGGLTLRELGEAAVRSSDNAAANLLLREFGGPAGVDAALAALGDGVTSLDRFEPDLNEAAPGDDRDTSTARALAEDLQRFVVGDGLARDDRALLTGWLQRSKTGAATVRAGAPAGWRVGSKTGTGGHGVRNDIAVLWPPDGAPVVLAVLTRGAGPDSEPDDALVAEATRVVLAELR